MKRKRPSRVCSAAKTKKRSIGSKGKSEVLSLHGIGSNPEDSLAKRKSRRRESKHNTINEKIEIVRIEKQRCFIHYVGQDKRLDEWVDMKRLGRKALIVDEKYQAESPSSSGANDVKRVEKIELGVYEIDTWYFSPYPSPYCDLSKLFICPRCFGFYGSKTRLVRHVQKCTTRHPPGKEIYNEEGNLVLWKVDGRVEKMYCQNLCLLSRLFLDSKTLYYDVDGFEFFVLTVSSAWMKNIRGHSATADDGSQGHQVVGYYSREKNTTKNLNLACILTLPPFQGFGFGKFLISLSYEVSIAEGRNPGAPERPISDLGLRGYQSYWKQAIMRVLLENREKYVNRGSKELSSISLREISVATGIQVQDVTNVLLSMGIIIKYKGRHMFRVRQKDIDEYHAKREKIKLCNPQYIKLC